MVSYDVHWGGCGYTIEVASGNDITSHFCSLPREFGKLPSVDQAVGLVMIWTFVSTFGKKLKKRDVIQLMRSK